MAKRKQSEAAEQPAPKKLKSEDPNSEEHLSDTITFYVGPDMVEIAVHRKILFKQVRVFEITFRDYWKSGTADLPEDDPITFQRFVNFLYFGKIGVLDSQKRTAPGSPDWDYMRLYAFAHKYRFNSLMDYAFSRLFFYYENGGLSLWSPTVEAMIFASQNTSAECALQRYMNKRVLRTLCNCEYSDKNLRQFLKECPETVFYIMRTIRDNYALEDADGLPEGEDEEALCVNYHLHGDEVACPVPKPEDDYLI